MLCGRLLTLLWLNFVRCLPLPWTLIVICENFSFAYLCHILLSFSGILGNIEWPRSHHKNWKVAWLQRPTLISYRYCYVIHNENVFSKATTKDSFPHNTEWMLSHQRRNQIIININAVNLLKNIYSSSPESMVPNQAYEKYKKWQQMIWIYVGTNPYHNERNLV